jgi:hypothetical protein
MEGGANAEIDRLSTERPPRLTLEEYARTLATDPPSEARVRTVAAFADAQGAGTFYILLDQALSQAAHAVLAEFRPDAPGFTPLAGDPLAASLEASRNAAIVSVLHRDEAVPDDVIRRATAEFASPAGAWYTGAYAYGVAAAIRAAGQRVVAALSAPR